MRVTVDGITTVAIALAVVLAAAEIDEVAAAEAPPADSNCVSIGKPQPSVAYTYEHSESAGKGSRYTDQWESVTDRGSRVRVTRGNNTQLHANEHHVVDDVTVLDRTTKMSPGGGVIDSTAFRPGIISDLAFRACAGRSWPIRPVTASYQSDRNKASAQTPVGILRIVAIREAITVPAGKFETVHYIRTSQSTDEYWKSIEHGVVVKHVGRLPGGVVTEVLLSIR